MVCLNGPILWVPNHGKSTKGYFGILSPRRWSQPVVEMVELYISWRNERGYVGSVWRGTVGLVWTYERWRFWWGPLTHTTSRISTRVSTRIWEVGQLSSGVDSKGVGRDLYRQIKIQDCWRYSDVQTMDTERSYQPCENEGWTVSSITKIHTTTLNQLSITKSSRSSRHQTNLPSQTLIMGRNAEKMNHGVVLQL